jgi:hypothetical protein
MRRVISAVVMVVMAVAALPVFAQAPTSNVSWIAGPSGEEQTYTGTTTFLVDAKGVVSGKLAITMPAAVNAALAGRVENGTWTFEYAYEIPDQMCTGVIKGTASVGEGRKVIEGTATIGGSCALEPFGSSFKMTLREK